MRQNTVKKILALKLLLILCIVQGFGQIYSDGFDSPLGLGEIYTANNDGDGWKCDRDFTEDNHLGEDWNGESGGNTDCDAPIYSASNGYVILAENEGSCWGNVIIVRHTLPKPINGITEVETMYGHLREIEDGITVGSIVQKGDLIGTLGGSEYYCAVAGGTMYCHLHFELREPNCRSYGEAGSGYSSNSTGWLDPSIFIENNRILSLTINDNVNIYAGNVSSPQRFKIWFQKDDLPTGTSITNFKIGDVSIPSSRTNEHFYNETTGKGSFYVDLLASDVDDLSNQSYDISFEIDGDENKFFGQNQIYFLNPVDFLCLNQTCLNKDVYPKDWFASYVLRGLNLGLFKGIGGTSFNPHATMTRAEMSKVVVESAIKLGLMEINTNTENGTFSDVPASKWYYPYVMTLKNYDCISGYGDGTFRPNPTSEHPDWGKVTVGQFAKILVNALQIGANEENMSLLNGGEIQSSNLSFENTNDTFKPYLERLYKIVQIKETNDNLKYAESIITGFNQFTINSNGDYEVDDESEVSRALMAKVIVNAYEYRENNPLGQKSNANLSNWTVIGDKFELISNLNGGISPQSLHTEKIMTIGEEWDFGDFPTSISGFPVSYYWTVSDGTLEKQNNNSTHNHIKFTAPNEETEVDLYLCIMIGNGTTYILSWDITVGEPEIETPTIQASNLSFNNLENDYVELTWQRGNGQYCILTCTPLSDTPENPNNNEYYLSSQYYDNAPILEGNTKILYVGENNSIFVQHLEYSESYEFQVFEFNTNEEHSQINYLLSNPAKKIINVPNIEILHTDFYWDPNIIQTNNNVSFITNIDTDIQLTEWKVDNIIISEPNSYNYQINHIFTIAGEHTVTLKATNVLNNQIDEITKSIYVFNENETLPDLVIENSIISSSSVYAGNSINIDCNLTNQGLTSTTSSLIHFYLSSDDIFQNSDIYLDADFFGEYVNQNIEPNQNFNLNIDLTIPNSTVNNTWYILCIADKNNEITEINENNNIQAIEIEVVLVAPDIIIENLTLNTSNCQSGDTITIYGNRVNISSSFGNNYGYTSIFLSATEYLTDNFLSETKIYNSNSADNIEFEKEVNIPFDLPDGDYFIIVEADGEHKMTEQNENNNFAIAEITVSNPNQPTIQTSNLQISNISNNSLTFNWINGNGNKRIFSSMSKLYHNTNTYSSFNVKDKINHVINNNINDAQLYYDYYGNTKYKPLYEGSNNNISIYGLTAGYTYFFSINEGNGYGVNSDFLQKDNTILATHIPINTTNIWNLKIDGNREWTYLSHLNNHIFAGDVSGNFISSKNKGNVWDLNINELDNNFVRSIEFINETKGFVLGSNKVYKTNDSGINWTEKISTDFVLREIEFISENHGFVVGTKYPETQGILLETTDAGNTWSSQFYNNLLYDITSFNNILWICGNNNLLMKSINEGNTWINVNHNINGNLRNIKFINENIGFVSIDNNVYKTDNGGNLWNNIFSSDNDINSIHIANNGIIYIFFNNTNYFIKSLDSGNTWNYITPNDFNLNIPYYSKPIAIQGNDIYIGISKKIYHSSTGGEAQAIDLSNIDFGMRSVNYCTGLDFSLSFNTLGTFNNDNIFTVELSDASGFFSETPITLGNLVSNTGGTIDNILIPENVASSDKYRIRIKSSNPFAISNASDYISLTQTPQTYISNDLTSYYLNNEENQNLSNFGYPVGGTFTLDNEVVTSINPSSLSIGEHLLTYTYSNGSCENSSQRTIYIAEAHNITISNLSNNNYCAYSPLDIDSEILGEFHANNQFFVELSDENGIFTNPENIATGTDLNNISCVLPYNLSSGNNYKIRVRSTNPEIISNETNTFNVQEIENLSIEISSDEISICEGTAVNFTGTYENTGISNFQWRVNGENIGDNLSNFTSTELNDGDIISCVLTSDAVCAFPELAISNSITMNVENSLTPIVELYSLDDEICQFEETSFNAFAINGGENPVYTWTINGTELTTNSDVIEIDTLSSDAIIGVSVLSNAVCATMNTVYTEVDIDVNTIPSTSVIPNGENDLSQNPINQLYTIDEITDATLYEWQIIPENAGVLSVSENNCIIDFDNDYLGIALLKVRAINGECIGDFSETLQINISEIQTFEVITNVNVNDGGTVTGAGIYNENETITLTAVANEAYNFINWTENGNEISTNTNYSFTVLENRNLVANFELQSFEIIASANSIEGGSITGSGIFEYDETVTLTAVANENYNFINWTENENEISTNETYTFTVSEDRNLIANFDFVNTVLELENINSYRLFPNPTNDLINISFNKNIAKNQNITINLIDAIGKTKKLDIIKIETNLIQVNVKNYTAGIYYLQIMLDNQLVKTFKLIISE